MLFFRHPASFFSKRRNASVKLKWRSKVSVQGKSVEHHRQKARHTSEEKRVSAVPNIETLHRQEQQPVCLEGAVLSSDASLSRASQYAVSRSG